MIMAPILDPSSKGSVPLHRPTVNEILVRGKYYDVSEFKKRHPGGSIIGFYLGQDATEAFNAFHARSTKAEKYLASLPSRSKEASGVVIESYQETNPLVADFEKLRQQLYQEGFFKPSLWHIAYRLAELIIMHAIAFQLIWNGWLTLGVCIFGIAQGRCGWLMHEAGHYSLTGNMTLDRNIQEIVYGVGTGMSAVYWRNQHNKHHAMPQKLKHDVDIQTLPLVAFHARIAKHGQKDWLRWQAFTFSPVVTFLVTVIWQFYQHPRHSLRTNHKMELFYYFLRYTVLFGFILREFSFLQQVAIYVAYDWVGAIYIFTNFALSHTHTPILEASEHLDWVRFAAFHTVDVEQTTWCDWWMGYLNYQIEHHLFPTMPQFRNAAAAPRVKALFEKHGVPYRVLSYAEALSATFANLHSVGKSTLA